MSYNHTTLTAAENALAVMLGDLSGSISKVRWPSAELQINILEALRTWSGLTGIHEATTDPLTVAAGTNFIDLLTSFPDELGDTVTDRDVIGPIQYHLLEPYDPIDGTGMSEMLTFDEIVQAVERRRNRFLMETGIRTTRTTTPASPAAIESGTPSYALTDAVMDVKRLAWIGVGGGQVTQALRRSSSWSVRSSAPRLNAEEGTPRAYTLSERAPLTVEFNPVPSSNGRLDLISVNSGATLVPGAGSGTVLGVPDDYAWVIKWGALADLLAKDGAIRDYARSLFCERRYRIGVAAAMTRGVVTDAVINGRPAQFATIQQLDAGRPYWQSRSGTPKVIATVAPDRIAIADPPSSSAQLQMSIVRKAPVPPSGGEYLQIGREHLGLVIGYAAHLSMFKIGGQELAATTHLAESFFNAAADINTDLMAAFDEIAATIDKPDEQKKFQGIRRVTGATVGEAQ